MTPNSHDTKSRAYADRDKAASPRDGASARELERERRISAAQMAAPAMRTWRRAGRFGSPT